MEDKVDLLIASYGLERLLEDNDLTEEVVLTVLIEKGLVDLGEYFSDE